MDAALGASDETVSLLLSLGANPDKILDDGFGTRAILISLFLRYPILHAPMFCHLPQGFQNCFCFCSTTFPSHVGTFFRLQWEFQWENDQNK